jgi:hypothetical protein
MGPPKNKHTTVKKGKSGIGCIAFEYLGEEKAKCRPARFLAPYDDVKMTFNLAY